MPWVFAISGVLTYLVMHCRHHFVATHIMKYDVLMYFHKNSLEKFGATTSSWLLILGSDYIITLK